jgi:hypothetical protein
MMKHRNETFVVVGLRSRNRRVFETIWKVE